MAEEKFLLVGYPSPALVGAFAVSYIVHKMKMEFREGLEFSDVSPNYFVNKGQLEGPIRIYHKDNIYAALSMMPLDLKLANDFGKAVSEFAQKNGINTILVPRGLEVIAKSDFKPKQFAFGIGRNSEQIIQKNNLEVLPRATIFGADAGIVSALKQSGLDCVFLYTPSKPILSDGKATVDSVKTMSQILGIKVDAKEIQKSMSKIKKQNEQLVQQAQEAMKKPESKRPYSIYR